MMIIIFTQLFLLGLCAPVFNIAPTEALLRDAMASQSSVANSIRKFNPGFDDVIHLENFAVHNKLSATLKTPKLFKEIMTNQQQAVAKSQKQLDALRSLQASNLHPVSDDLIASAENSFKIQNKALASLENIYEASLTDRKAASLLKHSNANQLAQDKQIPFFEKVKAWKEQAQAARSIKSKDAQLNAIQSARIARNPTAGIENAAEEGVVLSTRPINPDISQSEVTSLRSQSPAAQAARGRFQPRVDNAFFSNDVDFITPRRSSSADALFEDARAWKTQADPDQKINPKDSLVNLFEARGSTLDPSIVVDTPPRPLSPGPDANELSNRLTDSPRSDADELSDQATASPNLASSGQLFPVTPPTPPLPIIRRPFGFSRPRDRESLMIPEIGN